jgi:hypothetical protein
MDKIRANIPRPSPYEKPSAVPFISEEALGILGSPYRVLVKPAVDAAKRLGDQIVSAAKGERAEYDPAQLSSDLMNTMLGPNLLAGPSGAGTAGVIRQPEAVAKYLRKLVKEERGKWGRPEPGDIFGEILRQPMYRGQRTVPEPVSYANKQMEAGLAPDFVHGESNIGPVPTMTETRTSTRHIGEPGFFGRGAGVSASVHPDIAVQYSKRPVGDDFNVSRVVPLFGERPENVVLNPTINTHQEIIRGAYENATLQMIADTKLSHPGKGKKFNYDNMREQLRKGGAVDTFNKQLTKNLQEAGFKGILHAPRRSGDFELQMFSGKDLMHIDERASLSPELQRLWRGKPDSDRPGPHKETANKWLKATEGSERGALNKIYKGIDLDALFPEELKR